MYRYDKFEAGAMLTELARCEGKPYIWMSPQGWTWDVNSVSQRYTLFKKHRCCAVCGIEGTIMALESHKKHSRPHFNMYAISNGHEILMTKDHIKPKSKGGSNNMKNYQTMCEQCNTRKGNRDITIEELRKEMSHANR